MDANLHPSSSSSSSSSSSLKPRIRPLSLCPSSRAALSLAGAKLSSSRRSAGHLISLGRSVGRARVLALAAGKQWPANRRRPRLRPRARQPRAPLSLRRPARRPADAGSWRPAAGRTGGPAGRRQIQFARPSAASEAGGRRPLDRRNLAAPRLTSPSSVAGTNLNFNGGRVVLSAGGANVCCCCCCCCCCCGHNFVRQLII